MGEDYKDGPKGEAKRGKDKDGNEYHTSADNRNISGSGDEADKRLKKRKVEDTAFEESGKAADAPDRLAKRKVAHERHPQTRDGFAAKK